MRTNDWINIERIMVFLRFNIKDKTNIDILSIIKSFTNAEITEEKFYTEIIDIRTKWKNQLIKSEINNKMIQDAEECLFLIKFISYAIQSIEENNFCKAYDIIDMLHAFPEVVLNGEDDSKKNFEKVYLLAIIKKWNIS